MSFVDNEECPNCGGTKIERQLDGMTMTLFCTRCGTRWHDGLLGKMDWKEGL